MKSANEIYLFKKRHFERARSERERGGGLFDKAAYIITLLQLELFQPKIHAALNVYLYSQLSYSIQKPHHCYITNPKQTHITLKSLTSLKIIRYFHSHPHQKPLLLTHNFNNEMS